MKYLFHLRMSLKILSQYILVSSKTIHEQPPPLHHCWICDFFNRTVTCWSFLKISSSSCTPFTFVLDLTCCIYNVLLPHVCTNLWWTLIVAECFTHKNQLTEWTSLQVKVSNVTANAHQLIPSSTIYCMFPILHALHRTKKQNAWLK